MRRLLLVVVFAGCGVESPREAARRDPVFMLSNPTFGGANGEQLGSVLSACPDGGLLAGAPGSKSAHLFPASIASSITSLQVGDAVACTTGQVAFIAGPGGLMRLGGQPLQLQPVRALAAHAFEPFPVLEADDTQVSFLSADGGTVGLGEHGDSVAWSTGRTFAIGDSAGGRATHFRYLVDGGFQRGVTVSPPDLGKTIALGELHPSPGEELAVADPLNDRVFIFSTVDAGLLMVLTAPTGPVGSFGASLLVEPGDAGGGLHALWVGHPNADTITRFVGDAGQVFDATTIQGSKFGAALAFEPPNLLSVGAPDFPSTGTWGDGAVFREPISSFLTPVPVDGISRACELGVPCEGEPCLAGTCVGGVICKRPFVTSSAICAPDAGAPDAGAPDAGAPDAGPPDAGAPDAGAPDAGAPDAGPPDAGAPDAGAPDAGAGAPDAGGPDAGAAADAGAPDAGSSAEGEVSFITRGCSTSPTSPLLLLAALALWRRASR